MNIQIPRDKFVELIVRGRRGGVVLTGNGKTVSAQTSGGPLSLPPHLSATAARAQPKHARAPSSLSVSEFYS